MNIDFLFDKNKLHFAKAGQNRGFLVLTMVLLVSATVLIVVTGSLLRSISEVNESSDLQMSLKAWSTVNACGEYALLQLASTTDAGDGWSYAGDESQSIPLPAGAQLCYIYPIADGDLGAKLIKASSTVSSFTKKILIEVATNTPNIVVNSWTTVADF